MNVRQLSEADVATCVWIFTANDIKVNTLVIVAAIAVAITDHPAPDLLTGAAIFLIVANGARRILALAR